VIRDEWIAMAFYVGLAGWVARVPVLLILGVLGLAAAWVADWFRWDPRNDPVC